MKIQLLFLATAFLAQSVGGTEAESKKEAPAGKAAAHAEAAATASAPAAGAPVAAAPVEAKMEVPVQHRSRDTGKCLASEEIISDLEARESTIKQKEAVFVEREKELEAQRVALKEEMAKLELIRAEIQGINGRNVAENEEKVNKLMDTFESMSPKSAAAVISKVDEDLAVTALSRLSTAKAAKILSAMDPVKSSHLSEMLAFGNSFGNKSKGKEKDDGEPQRAPASKR